MKLVASIPNLHLYLISSHSFTHFQSASMSGMHVLTACLCYILGFRLRGHLARPKEKIEKAVVLVWLFVCLFVYLFVCLFVYFI
jgi:hypothetical protein